MARVVADVTGDKELIHDLRHLGDAGVEACKEVLADATARIAARAKTICPVDDYDGGDLRDSIRTTKPQHTTAQRVSAAVIAGGEPLAKLASEKSHREPGSYAVVVHEDMTMRHPNGGQAKFIEQPYLEEAPKVPDALKEKLDRVANG